MYQRDYCYYLRVSLRGSSASTTFISGDSLGVIMAMYITWICFYAVFVIPYIVMLTVGYKSGQSSTYITYSGEKAEIQRSVFTLILKLSTVLHFCL